MSTTPKHSRSTKFQCTCGKSFKNSHGLHVHQAIVGHKIAIPIKLEKPREGGAVRINTRVPKIAAVTNNVGAMVAKTSEPVMKTSLRDAIDALKLKRDHWNEMISHLEEMDQ